MKWEDEVRAAKESSDPMDRAAHCRYCESKDYAGRVILAAMFFGGFVGLAFEMFLKVAK